jgi:hypothetical protein
MTDQETARSLDHCAEILSHMARVYRGEAQDLTGRGMHAIFFGALERALDVKVVQRGRWEEMLKQTEEE